MNKPKYTMVRMPRADYELLQKAKAMMERQPGVRRTGSLGWTVGTLAEFYLLAKKRKII